MLSCSVKFCIQACWGTYAFEPCNIDFLQISVLVGLLHVYVNTRVCQYNRYWISWSYLYENFAVYFDHFVEYRGDERWFTRANLSHHRHQWAGGDAQVDAALCGIFISLCSHCWCWMMKDCYMYHKRLLYTAVILSCVHVALSETRW